MRWLELADVSARRAADAEGVPFSHAVAATSVALDVADVLFHVAVPDDDGSYTCSVYRMPSRGSARRGRVIASTAEDRSASGSDCELISARPKRPDEGAAG
jgi:hypothetical protein